nr:MAG TPA: hypothetical protein [Caudoviricetes sp.]
MLGVFDMRERYNEVLEGYTILEDELKEKSESDRLMESSYQKWLDTLDERVSDSLRIMDMEV